MRSSYVSSNLAICQMNFPCREYHSPNITWSGSLKVKAYRFVIKMTHSLKHMHNNYLTMTKLGIFLVFGRTHSSHYVQSRNWLNCCRYCSAIVSFGLPLQCPVHICGRSYRAAVIVNSTVKKAQSRALYWKCKEQRQVRSNHLQQERPCFVWETQKEIILRRIFLGGEKSWSRGATNDRFRFGSIKRETIFVSCDGRSVTSARFKQRSW